MLSNGPMPRDRRITLTDGARLLIRQCRPGTIVAVDSLQDLAPRTDDRIAIVQQIFAKGASIQVGDLVIGPEHVDILVLGMASRRRKSPEAAGMHGGQNRVSNEDRAKALPYWQDHGLSTKQLENFTGYAYSTLRNWFQDEYPRPDKRGRPRKRK